MDEKLRRNTGSATIDTCSAEKETVRFASE
jgi:hypothetical protein